MNTLLVIEDHVVLRRNLCELLSLEGYTVLEAANGPDGICVAREHHPDLVLCDILLPGCDGFEVLACLRADLGTRAIPFVFLSAKGEPTDIRAGMNLGADDYLPKPAARRDILAAIQSRLTRCSQQRIQLPNFSSAKPLEKLGISPREADVLLWLAQGKLNHEIAAILGCSHSTVKKHGVRIFEKLGVETRGAAMLMAIEALSGH